MIHDEAAESWNEITAFSANHERTVSAIMDGAPKSTAIFGAGSQGRVAARYLSDHGISVTCFADNDLDKQGTTLDDIPVVSPHDTLLASVPTILIATRHAALSIRRQLDDLKLSSLSFDAFFVVSNAVRIAHVRNTLLNDDRSRLTYDAILKTMLTGHNSFCASVMEGNQYFALPDFVNCGSEHFVDAGAYVGDTIERFIWSNSGVFVKIYAFEPGAPQMTALKHRMERLGKEWAIPKSAIICENAGLADVNRVLPISSPDVLANTSLNNYCRGDEKHAENVCCYSLDSYLAGRPATFIKADVEGMELALLQGATDTIRTFRPKLALSIYHNPAHLIDIAEFVNGLIPEYRMAVRHHSAVFAESVLYCWVAQDKPGNHV